MEGILDGKFQSFTKEEADIDLWDKGRWKNNVPRYAH